MEAIYECVDSSSIGCFESPTGTGKSLSAICSTLYWQSKEEQRILAEQEAAMAKRKAEAAVIADDWMMAFQVNHENETVESKDKTRAYEAYQSMTELICRISLEDPKQRSHDHNGGKTYYTGFMQPSSSQTFQRVGTEPDKQAKVAVATTSMSMEPEDEFALGDYDSEDDVKGRSKSSQRKGNNRNKTLSTIDDDDDSDADDDDVSGLKGLKLPQIFYCSRTHSQISQFVSEIKRTVFAHTRVVTLGSRRNLCINPVVSALKIDSKISEKCLELQKSKEKKDCNNACSTCTTPVANPPARKQQKTKVTSAGPCTFHQRRKEQTLADYTLAKIRDIEDIVTLGTQVLQIYTNPCHLVTAPFTNSLTTLGPSLSPSHPPSLSTLHFLTHSLCLLPLSTACHYYPTLPYIRSLHVLTTPPVLPFAPLKWCACPTICCSTRTCEPPWAYVWRTPW